MEEKPILRKKKEKEKKKISRSVRIANAGSLKVCKQYIILNHMLSEKTTSFPKTFQILDGFSHMTHQIETYNLLYNKEIVS